ncbi:hypothetical protein J6590_051999 [Homalodisca vitripennis]|nr:hypothetical protein J6590_051999 [Homalodisca vitripennis]
MITKEMTHPMPELRNKMSALTVSGRFGLHSGVVECCDSPDAASLGGPSEVKAAWRQSGPRLRESRRQEIALLNK